MASAQLAQQRPELLLLGRAQGVAHGRRPGSKTAASSNNPGSGLSHFGILDTGGAPKSAVIVDENVQ
jgi:hypothetical protein